MARHKDLLGLARSMDKLAKRVPQAVNELVMDTARAILKDLVYVTPVDTSLALSNWQVSLTSPKRRTVDAFAYGRKGSTKALSAEGTILAGELAISKRRIGQTIWIINNISYIGDLDNGYSRQFAGGFATRVRAVATRVVNRNGIKL